jgi:hypothetical protein
MAAPDDPGAFEPFDAFTDDGPAATVGEPAGTAAAGVGGVLDPAERIELGRHAVAGAGGAGSVLGLPGGAATGLFLHAVLEKVALGPLPSLDEWRQKPEVRQLIEAELRRWDRQAVHFDVGAAWSTPP